MTQRISFLATLWISVVLMYPAAAQDVAASPTVPDSAGAGQPVGAAQKIPGSADSIAALSAAGVSPLGDSAPATVAQASMPLGRIGCVAPPSGASEQQVSAFIENPASLLSNASMTSLEISARVRALVGADTRTLDPMAALLVAASADQRTAIGSGLGRAAFACQEVNPIYANAIQARVADVQYADVRTAFIAATNDIQVAAIAGASSSGAAGAPGLSGGGAAGPGTAGMGGDDTTPTFTPTYNIGHGGGAIIGGERERVFAVTSVSPGRL